MNWPKTVAKTSSSMGMRTSRSIGSSLGVASFDDLEPLRPGLAGGASRSPENPVADGPNRGSRPERSRPPGVNMYVPPRSCLSDSGSPSKAHQRKEFGLASTRLKLAIPPSVE